MSRKRSKSKSTKRKKSNAGSRGATHRQRFSISLIVLGVVLFLGSSIIYKQLNQLPVTQSLPRIEIQSEYNPQYSPEQITISTLLDIPIITGDFLENRWTDSKTAAIFYNGSALPLTAGNTIIYAHNTKNLFGNLKKVKVGDVIALRLADSSIRQYQVTNVQTVDPSNVEPLQPTEIEQLTLYTCTGPLDSKRLVITAIPSNIE